MPEGDRVRVFEESCGLQAFGYFITAPATHYWHKLLERLFPNRSQKDGKIDDLSPLKKVSLLNSNPLRF